MSQLSLSLVPGYLPADDELITPAILRAIARPSVTLSGTIGSASLADGAVTTPKLADGALSADTTGRNKMADGYLTASKLFATQDWSALTLTGSPTITWAGAINFATATFTPPPGMLVQQKYAEDKTLITTSAAIPIDDVAPGPQIGEGVGLPNLSVAITPKAATNILEIEVFLLVSNPSASTQVVALFQTTAADPNSAVAVSLISLTAAFSAPLLLRHRMVSATVAATTFSVRVGTNAGTLNINGVSGAHVFQPISAARIYVKEISA